MSMKQEFVKTTPFTVLFQVTYIRPQWKLRRHIVCSKVPSQSPILAHKHQLYLTAQAIITQYFHPDTEHARVNASCSMECEKADLSLPQP